MCHENRYDNRWDVGPRQFSDWPSNITHAFLCGHCACHVWGWHEDAVGVAMGSAGTIMYAQPHGQPLRLVSCRLSATHGDVNGR